MHPSIAQITVNAHARDLQRLMNHKPKRRPRRRPAWTRKSS
jgi:hypothetical protein